MKYQVVIHEVWVSNFEKWFMVEEWMGYSLKDQKFKLHREVGPATHHTAGCKVWYQDGTKIKEETYEIQS